MLCFCMIYVEFVHYVFIICSIFNCKAAGFIDHPLIFQVQQLKHWNHLLGLSYIRVKNTLKCIILERFF